MVLWKELIQFLQNMEENEVIKTCVQVMATKKSTRSQGAEYTGSPLSLPHALPSPRQNTCFPGMYLAATYFQGFPCTTFSGGKEKSKTRY